MKFYYSTFLLLLLASCSPSEPGKVKIEASKWEHLTIDFAGPSSNEMAAENPFVNYRLDVNFYFNDSLITIPGFYAADGNAAETSADTGSVWRVHFRPDQVGEWRWEAVFRHGDNIVYEEEQQKGDLVPVGNQAGTITVGPAAPGETGRLTRQHPRYLQWAETGKYFLKGGADSPENLLAYKDIDGTYRHSNSFRDGEAKTEGLHHFTAHERDFVKGSPTWQNGKGKGILGGISYLASKGINSFYFLTMNIGGDGKDVWPFVDHNTFDRFDVSKLDQWERIFDHADGLGMMLHFVLQETENEALFDGGDTGPQRKLYFRELIARFGHHRAITWNLGEENGPNSWSGEFQTNEQQVAMISWLEENDPNGGYIVLHTHPGEEAFAEIYEPLLGNKQLGGLALQLSEPAQAHKVTKKWLDLSAEAGAPWIMTMDETGPWWRGLDPDAGYTPSNGKYNNQDSLRAITLWANLMAGGAGVEWYFGAKNNHNDLSTEDWRSRDRAWAWTAATIEFFQKHVPFAEMNGADELVTGEAFCFVKPSHTYLAYLPFGKTTELDLSTANGNYKLTWYKGLDGLAGGEVTSITGGKTITLAPPGTGDWAALLVRE